MTMPLSRKVALALVAAGALALGAWLYRSQPRATHPLDAVPADAFVAIEVDVGALRRSGALTDLFGDSDEQSLTKVCGFDPVNQMEDLVFAVPEGGDGDFGVAVQANVSQDDLVRCANEVVKAHGGDPTPDIASRGSYQVITPHSTSSGSTKPARSLAYHSGSPILVGPKSWLYTMIDTLDDASQGHGSPGEHRTLRTGLAEGISPPPKFLLTATVLLEKAVREKLKAEMVSEVGPGQDSGTAMMLGVLGMSSGVLGLYERGDDIRAVVDLRCEEEIQCIEVEKLIRKVRGEWAKMGALRTFGLGPVLDGLEVDHRGTKLEVRASAPTADVVKWAKLFLASKPLVASTVSAGATVPMAPAAGTAPTPAASVDVPTQTVRIRVPEGVAPGQPFTVSIPGPGPSSAAAGVRTLTATVPVPSSSPSPPRSSPHPP